MSCVEEDKCKVKGEMVCIDRRVVCDTHPHCDDGRDELNCKESYLAKGLIKEGATFRCQSPHHNQESETNTVVIWAVRSYCKNSNVIEI